jgi:hypothetical protein
MSLLASLSVIISNDNIRVLDNEVIVGADVEFKPVHI